MSRDAQVVLVARDIEKRYKTRHGTLRALDGVSFEITAGETLAVVGESGCGKTTLALAVLALISIDRGTMAFAGPDSVSRAAERRLKRDVSVVFQNPASSLNPRMKIQDIVREPLVSVFRMHGQELTARVNNLLNDVGLGAEHSSRYPHELSGGQLQRVAIARALAVDPRLIVLDEPTAALDVSVQAQTLSLLKTLQRKHGFAYLFITHDLAAASYIADTVMVMYLGRVVETGPIRMIFKEPRHPYTKALLDAVPAIDPNSRRQFSILSGEIPSPLNRRSGCAFAPRCSNSSEYCHRNDPVLSGSSSTGRFACHHPLKHLEND